MYCINCSKAISNRSKYCSIQCQKIYQQKMYIQKWKNNEIDGMRGEYQISSYIKKYIFDKYNNKCSRCGWNKTNPYTGTIPLEIEHIDRKL